MQSRIFTGRRPTRHVSLPGFLAAVLIVLALAGCQTAPPPKVQAAPALAERQVQALQSLGFVKKDEGWLLSLPEPISFEFGQAKLKPGLQTQLDGFATQLLGVQIHHLLIEGHSDNVGPRQFNLDLSKARAEAVAQELLSHGFASSDVERIGLGPDHPATSNETREGRAQNRRVEIVVPASALALQP
jgi:outer membrane protein OmpA-like peptidoglycan-associated protein